jgi:hypothetical protein
MIDTVTRQTKLRDAHGRSHDYVAHMHGAIAGIGLGTELIGLLGETVQLQRGLGACLTGLAQGIVARGDVKLVERLLEHTSRDGERLTPAVMERAYQANYGELLEVLAWIVEENFGSFSEAAVRTLAPRLAKMLQPKQDGGNWLASLATGASGLSSGQASAPSPNSATSGAPPT